MSFKEDIKEAKERLKAWWDHEIIDRPCISYWDLQSEEKSLKMEDAIEVLDPWYLAEHWDNIEISLKKFEIVSKNLYFGGENIPRFFPNYGPGIIAAVLGCKPKFMSKTVWFNRPTAIEEIVPLLESTEINLNNPWYARLVKVTEFAAKRGGKKYSIAMTDLGGVLDILSSFLGPQNIIFAMRDHPDIIDICRSIIIEKLLHVYDDLQKIIELYGEGCNSWMNVWCPKRWYPIQSDFSAMLSPKWFKRFVLPDIITQAEHMDYGIYHLDGPDQIKYLDDLLDVPSIHGIQWVPGAREETKCSDKWLPVYKKIQDAGKNIIIDFFEDFKLLSHFYSQLDPKGLFVTAVFFDKVKSAFYLPKFIGGKDGIGDFKSFRREYRKHLKNEKI